MATITRFLQSLGLLIARLGLGGILLLHGWTRWRTQGIARQVEYLNQFGTPYPEVAAWGAVVLELVGGVFLIVGALTPFVGLAVLLQQVLTVAYTNWYRTPHLLRTDGSYNGGYEYNVALGLLGLIFCVFGGGAMAIDRLFRRKKSALDEDEDDVDATTTTRIGRPATV